MTVIGSDFDYKNAEFTSQAINNRLKRHQRLTPIMQWEFSRDMIRMMTKIRAMKPDIDNKLPKRPSLAQAERHRLEVEEGRLRIIEQENREMLGRLKKIHNRPRSAFCNLKRKGDYLVKGDAFRLPPPSGGKSLYLVEMYKKLKLANPISARKSIRIQQEMLTSAIDKVARASKKDKPSEEMVEILVQATLATIDEVPSPISPEEVELSVVELVQLANPNIDVQFFDEDFAMDLEMTMSTKPTSQSNVSESSSIENSKTLEAQLTPKTSSEVTTTSTPIIPSLSSKTQVNPNKVDNTSI